MKPSSERPGQIGRSSHGVGEEQAVRLWLVGSLSLLLVACVVAALVYSSDPQLEPPETSRLGAGGAGLEPVPLAPRITSRMTDLDLGIAGDRDPLHAVNSSLAEGLLPQQDPAEAATAEDNESPEFDPGTLSDPATLRVYLGGGDAVLADAILQVASRRDREIASRAILDIVRDGTEPRRLEVLQRLCASPYIDAETQTSALRTALHDPDSALVTHAVRELSDRSDETALGLLTEALDTGERSTKLVILASIASNNSAESLLQQGLNDLDESVRNSAKAALSLQNWSNGGAGR